MWFYVIGILKPAVLIPEIDSSALIGYPSAKRYLNYTSTIGAKTTTGPPTTIYVRAQNSQVQAVDSMLADTTNPENPNEVDVSQPSATIIYSHTKHWAVVIPTEAWAGGWSPRS